MRYTFVQLRKERFFNILLGTISVILFGAVTVFFADNYYSERGLTGIFDAVWWAVVTIATVGYGDIVPTSTVGKIAGLIVIISGPVLLSLVTASVASVLVEKKIMEGKGLEAVRDKDHVIVCGWNENGDAVIGGISDQSEGSVIVLVNELDRDDFQTIQYRHKEQELRFVRGNFVKEDVLARANLARARAAIVLADTSGGHAIEKADERTIFGTMAIKAMASKVRTCAELIHSENREHLRRANVDEILVRGESAGSMLAKAATAPGITDALRLLINDRDENKLWRLPATRYEGRAVAEMASAMRERHGAMIVAVIKEKQRMSINDILSDDLTLVDQFIKRKFEESGKDFFGEKKDVSVILNPDYDYELNPGDWVLVLSKERPY